MSEPIYSEGIHTVFQKSSPFISEFDKLVSRLRETGVLHHIQHEVIIN